MLQSLVYLNLVKIIHPIFLTYSWSDIVLVYFFVARICFKLTATYLDLGRRSRVATIPFRGAKSPTNGGGWRPEFLASAAYPTKRTIWEIIFKLNLTSSRLRTAAVRDFINYLFRTLREKLYGGREIKSCRENIIAHRRRPLMELRRWRRVEAGRLRVSGWEN